MTQVEKNLVTDKHSSLLERSISGQCHKAFYGRDLLEL
jgi:hypothetical protein